MLTSISEFGLPKEYSKKKKFQFYISNFIPDVGKNTTINWEINPDEMRVFFTIDECLRDSLNRLFNGTYEIADANAMTDVTNGYFIIAEITYSASALSTRPIRQKPDGTPVDPEFNKDNLSFIATLTDIPREEMLMSVFKVDSFSTKTDETGKTFVDDFKMHKVVNGALQG